MRKIWPIVPLLIAVLQVPCRGQEQEYRLKTVFLEQFTRFIEWPKSPDRADTSAPFIIAIIGEDPFGPILERTYAQRKIKNRKVDILYISTPDEIPECHMLFVPGSSEKVLPDILLRTKNKPILTVGDTEGFARKGVLVNFYMSVNTIKFEVNEKAVHRSGLAMSYMLLNLARIVDPLKERK